MRRLLEAPAGTGLGEMGVDHSGSQEAGPAYCPGVRPEDLPGDAMVLLVDPVVWTGPRRATGTVTVAPEVLCSAAAGLEVQEAPVGRAWLSLFGTSCSKPAWKEGAWMVEGPMGGVTAVWTAGAVSEEVQPCAAAVVGKKQAWVGEAPFVAGYPGVLEGEAPFVAGYPGVLEGEAPFAGSLEALKGEVPSAVYPGVLEGEVPFAGYLEALKGEAPSAVYLEVLEGEAPFAGSLEALEGEAPSGNLGALQGEAPSAGYLGA